MSEKMVCGFAYPRLTFENKTLIITMMDFLDLPKYHQINVMNRWKYSSDKMMAQFGVKYLSENRLGGQKGFESIFEYTKFVWF